MFTDSLLQRGLGSALPIDPGIVDARPFQWGGLNVGLRYTLLLDLPLKMERTEHDARKNIAKAKRLGYRCGMTQDSAHVIECLADSERRKGFSHRLRIRDLDLLLQHMGLDNLSFCVCYSSSGEPAAARVLLHTPGAAAIDWVGGTKEQHLHTGATQLSTLCAIEEAFRRGASGYDLAGANIHCVAEAKMKWRARLVPYFSVQQFGIRSLARFVLNWRAAYCQRRGWR